MSGHIFIIDDEESMITMARVMLESHGYVVEWDTNPRQGLERVLASPPDLLLLDIRMRELDGFEVCKSVKAHPRTKDLPVIMISVAAGEADVVAGLELGADDYIAKPYREREVLARIKSVMRRRKAKYEPKKLEVGPLHINFETHEVFIERQPIVLSPTEFKLLALLAGREGQVVTRSTLAEKVWEHAYLPKSRSIDVRIDQLRKKLGHYGHWVHSLRGIGYRFEVEEPNV